MATYVTLLRGINVGGKNILPMQRLREILTGIGCESVATDEQFHLTESAFYLLAPSGIGRSKLAAGFEKRLGVAATSRNWRSTSKIKSMLKR